MWVGYLIRAWLNPFASFHVQYLPRQEGTEVKTGEFDVAPAMASRCIEVLICAAHKPTSLAIEN